MARMRLTIGDGGVNFAPGDLAPEVLSWQSAWYALEYIRASSLLSTARRRMRGVVLSDLDAMSRSK